MKIKSNCEWYDCREISTKVSLNLKSKHKVVLFKAKFELLFIMTKKPMMKPKLLVVLILFFSYLYKETSFSSGNLEIYLNPISFLKVTKEVKHYMVE